MNMTRLSQTRLLIYRRAREMYVRFSELVSIGTKTAKLIYLRILMRLPTKL